MEHGMDEAKKLANRIARHRLSRRDAMRSAAAFGAATAAMKLGVASAQTGEATSSQTRDEWSAEFAELYPMTPADSEGGTVIRADSTDIKSVNAILANDSPTLDIIGLTFDSLVGGHPTTGLPVPSGLADSWDISADGLTYTFHLNPNAKWHDGQPVTAEDVAFSLTVELDEAVGSSYTGTIAAALKSFNVVDDHTIELVGTDVNADFLLDVAVYGIMPKHIWENTPLDQWATDGGSTGQDPTRVIGSGPFKFVEWVQGDHVTLAKNDAYHDPTAVPHIDEFIFQVMGDDATTVESLLAGEIDLVDVLPAPDISTVQETEGMVVQIFPTFSFGFYGYNMDPAKTDLFQDQKVRQAFMYAIDRESVAQDIYLGYREVANGTQPLLSFAYAPDQVETVYNFDPEKAMALLEEAGWVDSDGDGVRELNGQKLAFQLTYPTGSATTDQFVAYIQEAWKQVGAEMTPNGVEFPQLVETITSTFDFEIALLGFNWDATANQGPMFNCDQYKVGFNFAKYCYPEVDELNKGAKKELDLEKRKEMLIQSMNIVNNELPMAIQHFRNDAAGFNARMQNYYATGLNSYWSLPYVWIQE